MQTSIACAGLILTALGGAPAASQESGAKQPDANPKLGRSLAQVGSLGEPTGVAFGVEPGTWVVAESLSRRVVVLGPKGERLREFGVGLLRDPRDVALAGGGRIAVSDAGADAVFVFDAAGKLVQEFGGSGGARGQLLDPEGIDVAGELLAVADSGNDRVQVFRFDGSLAAVFGSRGPAAEQMNRPSDVAFAADGSIYVADLFHQRVQRFSAAGELLLGFGTPGPNPGQFGGPTGLAVHGTFVHVVDRDNSRVQIFDAAGELVDWYGIHALRPREGLGKLHYPLRLALSADGRSALISEPVEDRVQVLGPVDPNEEVLPPLPALPPSHFGGAVDADGPVVVITEPSIPKVLLFQMLDGEPIEIGSFGVYGSRSGQMLWPADVAVDLAARRIFVADSGSRRLLSYSFRFDPQEEVGFDPERVRFVAAADLGEIELGDFLSGSGTVSIEPAGLWRDGEGGLCLSDARQGLVWRLDSRMEISGCFVPPQGRVVLGDGCALAARGEAGAPRAQCVVDGLGGRVLELPSGRVVASGFARPAAVLATQAGELYVTDGGSHSLQRIGAARPEVARGPGLGSRELTKPRGLCELQGGRVLVMDWGNHRGMIFDRENKFVRAFGSQLFIRPTYADKQEKTPEPAAPTAPPPAGPRVPVLDGSRPWHAGRSAITHDGNFLVFWKPTPDPIVERQTFAVEAWVTRASTPNELAREASIELDAAMPEHGHGMNVVPRSTVQEGGSIRIEGTRLHMPGRWEVYFDVRVGPRTERAQVTLELD